MNTTTGKEQRFESVQCDSFRRLVLNHRHGIIEARDAGDYRYIATFRQINGQLYLHGFFNSVQSAIRWFEALAKPPRFFFFNTDRETQIRYLRNGGYIN